MKNILNGKQIKIVMLKKIKKEKQILKNHKLFNVQCLMLNH